MEINGLAPGRLAAGLSGTDAVFVQLSTNEVFDGTRDLPYREGDEPRPVNPYGESKLAGECAVSQSGTDHLIVRTAWVFGHGLNNFPRKIRAAADRQEHAGEPLRVVNDEWGNPTWAPDLASAITRALTMGVRGVLHVAGTPATTRYEWAKLMLADRPGLDLQSIPSSKYQRPAPVPRKAVLDLSRSLALGLDPIDWQQRSAEFLAAVMHEASR
jgi:dTDP-4-dehydrorhamnose reductase